MLRRWRACREATCHAHRREEYNRPAAYLPNCFYPAAAASALPASANCNGRRGAAGNGPGTTIKYMRNKTSGAAGYGLSATIKYLRRTTIGAAGNRLGATIKYLQRTSSGAACYGLGTKIKYVRSAASRRRGQLPGHNDEVPATHSERRRGSSLGKTIKYLRCTTRGNASKGRAQRSSTCDAQRAPLRAMACAKRSSTCDAQREAPRAKAGRNVRRSTSGAAGTAGIGLGTHDQVSATHDESRRR
jgi:hypothetical protein